MRIGVEKIILKAVILMGSRNGYPDIDVPFAANFARQLIAVAANEYTLWPACFPFIRAM